MAVQRGGVHPRAPHRISATVQGDVPLLQQLDSGRLSARGLDRVLKVAWTLADLGGKKEPELHETNAALGLWLGEEW
ncbi:hypothetical protein ACFQX6_29955 [Streptosporangium lutulentum]